MQPVVFDIDSQSAVLQVLVATADINLLRREARRGGPFEGTSGLPIALNVRPICFGKNQLPSMRRQTHNSLCSRWVKTVEDPDIAGYSMAKQSASRR